MKELKEFYIPFSSLKSGSNFFHNKIDRTFFEAFNYPDPHSCEISVSIDFRKEVHLMDVRINYNGYTSVVCDRCLGNLDITINGNFSSVIKFGHVEREIIKEEIIYIPYESHYFNVATIIYEYYLLNFPIRNIHPEGECDDEQLKYIHKYSGYKPISQDPRWEALKVLKNKKK